MSETDLTSEETAQFEAMMGGAAPPEPAPQPEPEPKPNSATPEPNSVTPASEPQPEKPPEKPVRLVPHAALHEERTKRQEETARREALERRIAELEARNKPPPAQEPDETTDPIASIAYLKAKVKEAEERQAREAEQRAEQERQQAAFQDLQTKVKVRVDAYAKDHPEYIDQVQFLRRDRFEQLMDFGVYTAEQAAALVQQEEIALGAMAVDRDLDIGAVVAKQALRRGWKPKEAEQPPADPPKAKPTAAEQKIDRIAKGQRAGISPSGAGGSGPEPEMSAETLLSLEGAAFDKAWRAHGKRLMGG